MAKDDLIQTILKDSNYHLSLFTKKEKLRKQIDETIDTRGNWPIK